jgi:salicylate hydroxylase
VPPGQVYIAGSFPITAGAEIPPGLQTPQALAAHYQPADGPACPPVRWIVDQLVAHHAQIHWARLQETPPCFRDPSGQVLFLGDSAHGMVPTLGQGATQAMEDACTAATLIARACAERNTPVAPRDVAALTGAVASAREERIRWVMDFSLDATAAMLEGGEPLADMGRLREPHYRDAFRRLWADVRLD